MNGGEFETFKKMVHGRGRINGGTLKSVFWLVKNYPKNKKWSLYSQKIEKNIAKRLYYHDQNYL